MSMGSGRFAISANSARMIEQAEDDTNKEPDYAKPLTLEVPILHMAIIDNRATNRFDTRAQHERGDAGDSINITDTLLSVASVNNDDFESIMKLARDDVTTEDIRSIETNNRYLWKVLEEDDDDI
ncbi:hypothetical protein RR48_07212 [Papilio machaon]|uniref:Uncharacterized protein n=1 Tax=Papilio machaon TaxID=76193 RepID=A0A194RIS8_PAPMA|nr:hypothetical protein RR48_07212 [Papilio machaon]